ncbi:MAG TPA: GNAT family N-acetyltransferase [Acidimicrobiales bacterium]|nr:GNAT family N-acetyltransferase [Acidimicrobiales bacterium]
MADAAVTVRPLGPDELGLFPSLAGPSLGPPGRDFLTTAAEHHYRPEWTWVAERDGAVVARAAWWGAPEDDHPIALDWFDLGPGPHPDHARVAVGTALLRAAHEEVRDGSGRPCEYHLFLPPDWRDRVDVRGAAEDRIAAAGGAGLDVFVERLRVEWAPPTPVRPASGRLRFSPADDDAVLLDVLERVNLDTLDAYTRRDVAREGPAAAARTQLEDLAWMPAPRTWWRLAHDSDGALVGVVAPTRNYDSWIVGYVGVVPEQRGRGYAADLLAEATAFLTARGAPAIRADTDTGNGPMAEAFLRAGYRVTARRVVMAPVD